MEGLARLVAPFTGAWIETTALPSQRSDKTVAPFTGAWIETEIAASGGADKRGRSLHGSVD